MKTKLTKKKKKKKEGVSRCTVLNFRSPSPSCCCCRTLIHSTSLITIDILSAYPGSFIYPFVRAKSTLVLFSFEFSASSLPPPPETIEPLRTFSTCILPYRFIHRPRFDSPRGCCVPPIKKRGEEARGFTTVRGAPQNGDGRTCVRQAEPQEILCNAMRVSDLGSLFVFFEGFG